MKKLIPIIVLIFAVSGVAQEKSGATLIDEFSKIQCEDFLARADNFFITLDKNPSAQGYLVVYGGSDHFINARRYESLLNGALAERRYDRSRIEIVYAPGTSVIKAEFWMVPANTILPGSWSSKWNFVLPPETKPFLWYADFSGMCGSPLNPARLNDYLTANLGSRVHVVIYANTIRNRQKGLAEAKNSLKTLERKRIRYFFEKSRGYSDPNLEYWLVPKRK